MKPTKEQRTEGWLEVTYTLPREQAREAAKKYFERYPKYGYDTHIPYWHVTSDGQIFFKIRRLPTCD